MKIVSVNVGLPREIPWRGKLVRTSIFKSPVVGPVRVQRLNVDGDQQSDLTVHGGADKAVYVYPAEHYAFWRGELPGVDLPWGSWGENLTTSGLLESAVHVGDVIRTGAAEFVVTQPRLPCFKLGVRFGRPDIVEKFLRSRRTGFYLRVAREGQVEAGQSMAWVAREGDAVTVADVVDLYVAKTADRDLLRRAVETTALPESWRERFRTQLQRRGA